MHVFTVFELYGFIQRQRLFYSFISLKDKNFVLYEHEMYVRRGLALSWIDRENFVRRTQK